MSTATILQRVASGELTPEQAQEEINKANQKPITYKVSEKGALSVYGLGRFPVTLYKQQWERLDHPDEVQKRKRFLRENAARLTIKD